MGKKKEGSTEEDSILESPGGSHKKHKKHKKHKHKKKKEHNTDDVEINVEDVEDIPKPAIKLKIKIGGHTLGTKSVSMSKSPGQDKAITSTAAAGAPDVISVPWEEQSTSETSVKIELLPAATAVKIEGEEPQFNAKKTGDDISDEEKEWLDALEAGTLDDYGELKKAKDPSLLTARQRSLLHGNKEDCLLELPSGYKAPELTEEQLQRRQQRAKKRREQAQEKREKDKKQTLERLLKKQEAKSKGIKHKLARKSAPPSFRYLNSRDKISIYVPPGYNFPFPQTDTTCISAPKPAEHCGLPGCSNLKKYNCSKTNVPLCSLECYKRNLLQRGLSPPGVKTA